MHYSIHSTRSPIRDSMKSPPISSLKPTNHRQQLTRVVLHYVTKTEELLLPDDENLFRRIYKTVNHNFSVYVGKTIHVFSKAYVRRILSGRHFYLAMSFIFGNVHNTMKEVAEKYEQERRRRKE